MRPIVLTTLLLLTAHALADHHGTTQFETPAEVSSIDFIPTSLQSGPNHTVSAIALSDGFQNTYTVSSKYGEFEATGIVDPQSSIDSGNPRELRLVLCGGDSCQKREFEVDKTSDGYRVAFVSEASESGTDNQIQTTAPQSELAPPPGALRNWLDSVVPQHSFTLLLFYRGFW